MSQQDITAKKDAQAFADPIGADTPRTHATGQTLGQRVSELQATFQQETAQAFAKAPGREQDVVALMMEEGMARPRTEATDALRAELGLAYPICPSGEELSRLSRMLYTARGLYTASGTEAGG